MSVTLVEVMGAARGRAAALAGEVAGYAVLLAADQIVAAPRRISAADVLVTEEGAVRIVGGTAADARLAELSLRQLLDALLSVASSGSGGLFRAARRLEGGGTERLVAELEVALIPANRSAARRALARLARETTRAREQGRIVAPPEPAPLSSFDRGLPPPVALVAAPAPGRTPVVAFTPAEPTPAPATPVPVTAPLRIEKTPLQHTQRLPPATSAKAPAPLDTDGAIPVIEGSPVSAAIEVTEAAPESAHPPEREQAPESEPCTRPEPVVMRRATSASLPPPPEVASAPPESAFSDVTDPMPSIASPTPSPAVVIATPSPAVVIATPSPALVIATPSPALVIPTPSPVEITMPTAAAKGELTPSPEIALATPSPYVAVAIPSPETAIATPSPSAVEFLLVDVKTPQPVSPRFQRSDVSELLDRFRVTEETASPDLCRDLKALAGIEATSAPPSVTPPPIEAPADDAESSEPGPASQKSSSRRTLMGAGLLAMLVVIVAGSAIRGSAARASAAAPKAPCRASLVVDQAPPGARVVVRAADAQSELARRVSRGPVARFDALPCGEALEVVVEDGQVGARRWRRIPVAASELLPVGDATTVAVEVTAAAPLAAR